MGNLIGLALGLCFFGATLIIPAPEGLSDQGWMILGTALLMATWWASEAIPVPATALVPILILPLFGVVPLKEAATGYANPLIFLFLGGMLIGESLQRWSLHRRIALNLISFVGIRRSRIVFGFMAATALLSMWISNTATTVMMVPIAASVVASLAVYDGDGEDGRLFGVALMLSIAYAASFGGIATLIGTPPNAMLAGFFAQTYNVDISFVQWMTFALPISIFSLFCCWLVLTKIIYRPVFQFHDGTADEEKKLSLNQAVSELGPLSTPELRVGLIFVTAALLWMFRPLLGALPLLEHISDEGIAIFCSLLLFLMPAGDKQSKQRLLDWSSAERIPWGILLLFGGGLSLASGISSSDLDTWLGDRLQVVGGFPPFFFILIVAGAVLIMTEIASNTATVAALLPIIVVLAQAVGMEPILLAVPVVLAASCAFMLPAATPPNAIVFSSGYLTIPDMVRAGVWINIMALAIVSLAGWILVPLLF